VPFNLSFTHIMVVGIVALIVLGPERLPGVARTAGNLYREWKRISGGLEAEVREVFSDFAEPFTGSVNETKDAFASPIADLRNTLRGTSDAPTSPVSTVSAASPLAPGLPILGPSTGLVSPGPVMEFQLPELAPPPEPTTFVPFRPGTAGPAGR
jgi:sec-independent protein translocase protein TatB